MSINASSDELARLQASPAPHIAVTYRRGATRPADTYTTSASGALPMSAAVGFLTRVQHDLVSCLEPHLRLNRCADNALHVFYGAEDFAWFVDPSIPADSLVGTLEVVKQSLVGAMMAQAAQGAMAKRQHGLVDALGQPIRG